MASPRASHSQNSRVQLTWIVILICCLGGSYSLIFNREPTFLISGASWFIAIYLILLPLLSLHPLVPLLVGLIFAADLVSYWTYQSPIGLGSVAAVAETDVREARELLRIIPFSTYARSFAWTAAFVLATRQITARLKSFRHGRLRCLAVGISLGAILFAAVVARARQTHSPSLALSEVAISGFVTRTTLPRISYYGYRYYRERKTLRSLGGKVDWEPFSTSAVKPEILVVVVGESARRDHLSLYGYRRKTSPFLDSIAGELAIFRYAVSPAPLTTFAVPISLSMARAVDYDTRDFKYNLVNLANHAGFKTAWLSNQGFLGPNDTAVTFIAAQSNRAFWVHNNFFMPSDDAMVLPRVWEEIGPGPERLVVIHLRGSHEQFVQRYPAASAEFKPDSGYDFENTINAYDNSIRYTDTVLGSIISRLRNRNAVLIYYSDHGLTERKDPPYLLHTMNGPVSRGTYDVPLIVWASSRWRTANPDKFEFLKASAEKRFPSENIFWLAAYLMGIERLRGERPSDVLQHVPSRLIILGSDGQPLDYTSLK